MADQPTVQGRIRIARDALGLTQADLAPLLDVRRQTVSEYETDAEVPRGALSLLAGCFADYPVVFAWLTDGGEVPELRPRRSGGARSSDAAESDGLSLPGPYTEAPGDLRKLYAAGMLDLGRYGSELTPVPAERAMRWLNRLYEAAIVALETARRSAGDASAGA